MTPTPTPTGYHTFRGARTLHLHVIATAHAHGYWGLTFGRGVRGEYQITANEGVTIAYNADRKAAYLEALAYVTQA
jgi:hypothetical protein